MTGAFRDNCGGGIRFLCGMLRGTTATSWPGDCDSCVTNILGVFWIIVILAEVSQILVLINTGTFLVYI